MLLSPCCILWLTVGCAGTDRYIAAAPVAATTWRALRAEHRVEVEFNKADGTREKKALRGALAVERPGKFRLAALGPGGMRLFDLLVVDGQVSVLYAFRAMEGSAFARAVQTMAADLAAAHLLLPAAPDRAVTADATGVTIRERGTTIRLSRFAAKQGHAIPTRLAAQNDQYRFSVEVVGIEVDPQLDPKLFVQETR